MNMKKIPATSSHSYQYKNSGQHNSVLIRRSVRFTETTEPGDKTAVRFTWVFNNDIINKNTAVRFTWFQSWF